MRNRDQQRPPSDIQNRIDEVRNKRAEVDRANDASAKAIGIRVGIDLFAGVVFGLVVGLALDRWLGTAPWLLIVFLFLGMGGGIRNVIRTAEEQRKKSESSMERNRTPE